MSHPGSGNMGMFAVIIHQVVHLRFMYFPVCVNKFIFKNKILSRRNSICDDSETRKNLVHSELKEGQCGWNTETKRQNRVKLKREAGT